MAQNYIIHNNINSKLQIHLKEEFLNIRWTFACHPILRKEVTRGRYRHDRNWRQHCFVYSPYYKPEICVLDDLEFSGSNAEVRKGRDQHLVRVSFDLVIVRLSSVCDFVCVNFYIARLLSYFSTQFLILCNIEKSKILLFYYLH